jgi:hypothetical protein
MKPGAVTLQSAHSAKDRARIMAESRAGGGRTIFGAALALSAFALLLDSEALGWLVAPVVFALLIVAITKVPLRTSLLTLTFCVLTLENPADNTAQGRYHSPVYMVGALLLNHMNISTGVKPLFMSGMDILLVALLLVALQRESTRSKIDRVGRVPTPRPLVQLALISLAGTGFMLLSGLARGGDMGATLWQMDRVVYLPIVFFLFHFGLRGPADQVAFGKVVLAAATLRAIAATIIIHTVYTKPDENGIVQILPYATSHNDSVTFAAALVILLALAFTRAGRRAMRAVYVLIPILVVGMISNHRRMVWVQVIIVPVSLYFLTPLNAIKRKIQRIVLMLSPIVAGYALVGWNSESGVFKPVHILRTVVDSKSDPSTLWRDIENFDLIATIKDNLVFGTGYGHPYDEVVAIPAVDYSLEKYLPHNSILGMLSYGGYFGYAAITLLWVVGAFFAMRAYYAATNAIDRATAISCFGTVLIYLIQCWGDLGLGAPNGVFLLAASLAIGGKLATATGAWQEPGAKRTNAGGRAREPVVTASAR